MQIENHIFRILMMINQEKINIYINKKTYICVQYVRARSRINERVFIYIYYIYTRRDDDYDIS